MCGEHNAVTHEFRGVSVVNDSNIVDLIVLQELRELATEDEKQVLEESLGSSRLGKKVDVMINKIEERLKLIETDIDSQETEGQLDADG